MAEEYNPEGNEDGGEHEEQEDTGWEQYKQAIVVLIDASPAVLEAAPTDKDAEEGEGGGGGGGEGEAAPRSFLAVAIDAVVRIMRWRIMHAPSDEIGVMLYGAAASNVDDAFQGVYEMVPLGVPAVTTIHKLQEFTDDDFRRDIGSRADADPADDLRLGLWAARDRMLAKTKGSKATSKRLFIFTCDEDPTRGNVKARELLDQRLDDLHHQRAWVEVFPLTALREPFDMTAFWNHAIQVAAGRGDESEGDDDGEGEGGEPSNAGALAGLPSEYRAADVAAYLGDVMARATATRPTARLVLAFPAGAGAEPLKIAVQMYSLVRPAGKPNKIKVTKAGFREVKTASAYVHSDGSLLSDVNRRAIHFKGKTGTDRMPRAIFDNSELEMVRSPRPAGVALLGFKPASCLGPHHTLAPARFLYPDERRLKGSTAAFIALHTAMLDQDRVAIARLVVRTGNAPSLVALVAQAEEVGEDGTQVTPPGLHVLQLPWRDELRFPERGGTRGLAKGTEPPKATQQQIDAAAEMMAGLRLGPDFRYSLREDVFNPHLRRHYDALEKLALGWDTSELGAVEDDDDPTLPDPALAQPNAAADAFSAAVYGDAGAGAAGKAAGSKRKAAEVDPGVAGLYAERDWHALAEADQLARLTNDQLKVYLRFHRLTLGGNKADLIARVKDHALKAPV